MAKSMCGLDCSTCTFREPMQCGGCIETKGHPFHGACPVGTCCAAKGNAHCGECGDIPCAKLYEYSYLDPEHGDKPQGARIAACRKWAAEDGHSRWENVLLTSAGWADLDGNVHTAIRDRFLQMVGKPAAEAKILFVPTAAVEEVAKRMAALCVQELIDAGILPENITHYEPDGRMTEEEALSYDAVYIPGGDTRHLLQEMRRTGFDTLVKQMVYAGKTYVGISAGSLIATPNIGGPLEAETRGLALLQAYLSVHCPEGTPPRPDLPLPHIPLTDRQAVAVSWQGYELVAG